MKFSNWVWGTFLLLAATLVLFNQFGGFLELGVGSVILTILAIAFFIQCIAHLSFAPLPVPLAVLYIVFQAPLGLHYIQPWTLILSSVLAAIGLAVLIPRKQHSSHSVKYGGDWCTHGHHHAQVRIEDGESDNNPSVNVSFGATVRYLRADALETVRLNCHFGSLEVFFDHAQLSPDGTQVYLDVSFGAITLYVPRNWQVHDQVNCTLGGVNMDNRFASPSDGSPLLRLSGSVSLGGLEIKYI